MEQNIIESAMWWVAVIEIPALAGLFALIWTLSREMSGVAMEAAKTYAPASQVRELELRITAHLLRIEAKLDSTALKAAALEANAARATTGGSHDE